MAKNITVVDARGRKYTKTYPKRAAGLVKKGRARFVNESVICLACPPYQMEDNRMDTMNFMNIKEQPEESVAETTMAGAPVVEVKTAESMAVNESVQADMPKQLDSAYLMQKIDQIIADSEYLTTALQTLPNLDHAGAAAAGNMIQCREQTNQRMIDFLEKMMGKMAI